MVKRRGSILANPVVKAARRYLSSRSMVQYATNKARADKVARQNRAAAALIKWANRTAQPKGNILRGVRKSAQESPKLQIMGQRRRRAGASTSKSKGFFRSGTSKKGKLDYFGKAGIVYAQEYGGVLTDTGSGPFLQSAAIGHANYSQFSLYATIALAMTKMIASKMRRQMINVNDIIEFAGDGSILLVLIYRVNTFSSTTPSTLTLTAGTTRWFEIARWFFDLMRTTFTKSTQLVTLRANDRVAGTPEQPAIQLFEVDLTKARIQLYNKSALKIQNRTINSAGNDESEDVDNVPLYGKSYEGYGNYAYFKHGRDTFKSLNMSNLQVNSPVDPIFGAGYHKYPVGTYKFYGSTGTPGGLDALVEPPVQSQFSHVAKIGKAHLDPAEIKSSVLEHSTSSNLNVMIKKIVQVNNANALDVPIGKYRFFIMEKMIQAVTTTEVNAIKLAYEVDSKYGCVITAPPSTTSTYVIDQQPL